LGPLFKKPSIMNWSTKTQWIDLDTFHPKYENSNR
jgi:hypothetical protein